jgi:hypothetical protein
MNNPSPMIMKNRPVAPKRPEVPQVVAKVDPAEPAKVVRPGLALTYGKHHGIVKTKQLQPGQRVRPFLHGEPRGGERIVETVTKLDDGAMVEITWASGHPTATYKAAYRWFDADLVGTPVAYVAPAFVAVR